MSDILPYTDTKARCSSQLKYSILRGCSKSPQTHTFTPSSWSSRMSYDQLYHWHDDTNIIFHFLFLSFVLYLIFILILTEDLYCCFIYNIIHNHTLPSFSESRSRAVVCSILVNYIRSHQVQQVGRITWRDGANRKCIADCDAERERESRII